MALEGTTDRIFLIYSLIYSNKLGYLQLITVLVSGNSPPKNCEKDYLSQTFSEKIKKYV